MSQRKWTPLYVVVLLFTIVLALLIISGYSNINKAKSSQAAGDYAAAASTYARAAQTLFWRGDLWEQAGISAALAGDYSAAIVYLGKQTPRTEDGWVWLATAQLQTGDVQSAYTSCASGLQAFDSARLYRLLAFVQRSQKNWDAERSALQNQVRLDANEAYAHYRLGVLLMLSSPENARSELKAASALDPEVDSAVQTLDAALALSSIQPDTSQQKLILGRALGLVQEWELAEVAFTQAVGMDENNAEAWAWLGEAKQQLGQDGSAELDQALRFDHTSANVRALRGLYWNRLNRYEQALAEYLLAAEFEPENPRWWVSIGEAHANLGDLTAALEAYQHAVKLAPSEAEYWRLLAAFCAERSAYVEEIGLPAAQHAQTLLPNDPAVLDTLGFAYLASGRYANAEQNLKKSLEISPEYFPAHLHLALTYLAQGERSAAFNSLVYVRDADSSGVYAEAARQLLERYFP